MFSLIFAFWTKSNERFWSFFLLFLTAFLFVLYYCFLLLLFYPVGLLPCIINSSMFVCLLLFVIMFVSYVGLCCFVFVNLTVCSLLLCLFVLCSFLLLSVAIFCNFVWLFFCLLFNCLVLCFVFCFCAYSTFPLSVCYQTRQLNFSFLETLKFYLKWAWLKDI